MGKKKRRRKQEAKAPKMDLDTAMDLVPDDLPDGAYFAMLDEMTGGEPGDSAHELGCRALAMEDALDGPPEE